jgi:hypothetical protein
LPSPFQVGRQHGHLLPGALAAFLFVPLCLPDQLEKPGARILLTSLKFAPLANRFLDPLQGTFQS